MKENNVIELCNKEEENYAKNMKKERRIIDIFRKVVKLSK